MTNLSLRKRKAQRARRVRAKVFGTAKRPRLSIFRSNHYVYAQLVDDEKGHTLLSSSTREEKTKNKKQDASRELGERLAKKAKEKGIEKAVFDRRSYQYHGKVKALAEGARSGGLKI